MSWNLKRPFAYAGTARAEVTEVKEIPLQEAITAACGTAVREYLIPHHESTFSRTVWRLYGGAKGLVMWC
jgi:hypothetical protein